MGRRAVVLAIAAVGIAAGALALQIARESPAWSFAGSSRGSAAALLAAGWALVGAGLAFWLHRPGSRSGPLLAGAGVAWFAPELANPGAGFALAFTAGLAFSGLCAPLVAHASLGYPDGRLSSHAQRGVVAVAYAAGLVLVGVLPTALSDPRAEACNECPRDLLAVTQRAGAAHELTRAGLVLGLIAALVVAILLVRRCLIASRPSRLVYAAAAAYLAVVVAEDVAFLDQGFLDTGTVERRLWLGQAAALIALAGAVAWALARARRARGEVARLVVDLAQSPPSGGLRDALAEIVRDPALILAYPLEESGRLVGIAGRPVELPDDAQRTSLVRDGTTVAVLAHRHGVLDDEQLVEEVTSAARLALENERLQAEVGARVEELRASRARIVAAGDAERRRLEHDLHDGAQQRLVALSLSLRLLRTRLPATELDSADKELRLAIDELRELAHGIFPAVLADEGLAVAIEALAEESSVPLRLGALAEGRFAPAVETAAYTVVDEVVRAARSPVDIRTRVSGPALAVELEAAVVDGIDVVGLEDRLGALDGRLLVAHDTDGHVRVHAELPCAS